MLPARRLAAVHAPGALARAAALAIGGLLAFVALIALAYGTPFVVAERLLLGGAVFLAGRFLVVALHELAHGLAMASVGRRVPRAGLKFFAVLPYAFVDTSEAWFEPRRRRIAISAAGPATDLALGGALRALLPGAGRTATCATSSSSSPSRATSARCST